MKYLIARHPGNPRKYTWNIPFRVSKYAKHIKPGDIVKVDTKYGKQKVVAEELTSNPPNTPTKDVVYIYNSAKKRN